MSQRAEKILNWLKSERNKDTKELEKEKQLFIQQIKKIKREEIFPEPKKLTLWQRIKVTILGN